MNTGSIRIGRHLHVGVAIVTLSCCVAFAARQGEAQTFAAGEGRGRWTPELNLGLKLEIERARAQERLEEASRDSTLVQGELELEVRQPLGARTHAFADLELRSERLFESRADDDDDDQDKASDDLSYRLKRLYLQHESTDEVRRWRLGRQSIDDAMSWVIDEELDGLRYSWRQRRYRFDASFTREAWVRLDHAEREDIVYNALGMLRIDASDDSRWTTYVLHRSAHEFDDSDPSEITWLGLQGVIRPDRRFRYWLNAATRRGQEKRATGDRELGGHAVDFGLTWLFDGPFRPSVTLGAARASGDSPDSGDEVDRFRQSGLQSNEFELNDRNRFRYLGEVLDPELSNLEILTLGVGTRIDKRWSVDLAYHRYRQVRADDRLRGSDIRYEPSGLDGDLGDALDLVVGFESGKSLDILAVAGLFDPGKAFEGEADPEPAWVVRLELQWDFGT